MELKLQIIHKIRASNKNETFSNLIIKLFSCNKQKCSEASEHFADHSKCCAVSYCGSQKEVMTAPL